MVDIDVSPSKTLINVYEFDQGRVASTSILHGYSKKKNDISVYLSLKNEGQQGSLMYSFPKGSELESRYLINENTSGGIKVHSVNTELTLDVYVRYSEETMLIENKIFDIYLSGKEKRIMSKYIFQIPNFDEPSKLDFPVKYVFYTESTANVSIFGSKGKKSDSVANSYIWGDLRKTMDNTLVTVKTLSLERYSQILLIIGTILIATGVNIITSYLYKLSR